MASKDRTGETCPFCGKGKLYPTGIREVKEPAVAPRTGEIHREFTEYECDVCHKKTGAHGVGLGAAIDTIFSAKVEKKRNNFS